MIVPVVVIADTTVSVQSSALDQPSVCPPSSADRPESIMVT
jgi:hypothetical protein